MMWWDHYGMGAWGYALMVLSMVVFSALVIAAIVLAIRYAVRADRAPGPWSAAEELLAQRYALGEIDSEEYHSRREALRNRHDHRVSN